MTIGNKSVGKLTPTAAIWWPSGSPSTSVGGNTGSLRTKVWNGGDSFPSRKSSRTPKYPLSRASIARSLAEKDNEKETIFYDGNFVKGRSGLNPNAWTCSFVEQNFPIGNSLWVQKYTVNNAVYQYGGWRNVSMDSLYATSPPPAPVFTPSDEYKLISRISNQIRGNDFNATVAASQSLQAVKMIGETATRLAKTISFVKKGNLVQAMDTLMRDRASKQNRSKIYKLKTELKIREDLYKDLDRQTLSPKVGRKFTSVGRRKQIIRERLLQDLKDDRSRGLDSVSSDWLALQYGWLPLLSDIHGAAELIAHQQNVSFVKKYEASIVRRVNLDGKYWHSGTTPSAGYVYSRASSSISKRLRVEVSAPPNVTSILGLQNPLSVVWELTPWSFVVDWFIPIGDYLQAMADSRSLNVTRVITTVKSQRIVAAPVFSKYDLSPSLYAEPYSITGITGYRYEIKQYDRTIGYSLNVPLPRFVPLKDTFSVKRALNALALIRLVR